MVGASAESAKKSNTYRYALPKPSSCEVQGCAGLIRALAGHVLLSTRPAALPRNCCATSANFADRRGGHEHLPQTASHGARLVAPRRRCLFGEFSVEVPCKLVV